MLKSYRARLVFYSIMLMVFLSAMMAYSYLYIYDLVIDETETHISRLAQSSVSALTVERHELERYAEVIANDLRLRQYMFIVTEVGGEASTLQELYDRTFASLPIDNIYIVDKDKNLVLGNNTISNDYVLRHFPAAADEKSAHSFFLKNPSHFESVATSRVSYRDNLLGYIAISRNINSGMLQKLSKRIGGHIFVSHDDRIILSSLPEAINKTFALQGRYLSLSGEMFRIHELNIAEQTADLPRIWLGLPETQLLARLTEHRTTILTILLTGIVAVFFIGLLLIRNFHRPLTDLMHLTREIGQGNFPQLKKTQAQNEIDELGNHFVDMVTALKDKQQEVERAHDALRQSAITDSLTGLHNRRYLQMVFPKRLAQTDREHKLLGAIIIDIDHFKKINDTYGHLAGDICLASFADELRETSRANDDLFRLGGEEFLILTSADDLNGIKAFAEKIRSAIEHCDIVYQHQKIAVTISAGISVATSHSSEQDILKDLLAQADEALYKAKNAGRNRVMVSPIVPHSPGRQQQLN
ncbi:MAG: diguanylate cyclase [Gammaproteobacteria bacterium]